MAGRQIARLIEGDTVNELVAIFTYGVACFIGGWYIGLIWRDIK